MAEQREDPRTLVKSRVDKILIMFQVHRQRPLFSPEPERHCHLSYSKTIDKIAEKYIWLGMTRDIRDFVGKCGLCRRKRLEKFLFNSEDVMRTR